VAGYRELRVYSASWCLLTKNHWCSPHVCFLCKSISWKPQKCILLKSWLCILTMRSHLLNKQRRRRTYIRPPGVSALSTAVAETHLKTANFCSAHNRLSVGLSTVGSLWLKTTNVEHSSASGRCAVEHIDRSYTHTSLCVYDFNCQYSSDFISHSRSLQALYFRRNYHVFGLSFSLGITIVEERWHSIPASSVSIRENDTFYIQIHDFLVPCWTFLQGE
jgi:hypothetical protein